MDKTRVVNKLIEDFDVDITRNSKWGNPFRIGRDGTRKEVIAKFMLYADNTFANEDLMELQGKILGCVCKPKSCHGDVYIQLMRKRGLLKEFF